MSCALTGVYSSTSATSTQDGSLLLVPWLFAQAATKATGLKLINEITWVKPNPQPRQFKRRLVSATEPIFHFVKSDAYRYFPERFAEGVEPDPAQA